MEKKNIQELLTKALLELGIAGVTPVVSRPSVANMGDYTTNVAMIAHAKSQVPNPKSQEGSTYKNPREMAEAIVAILNTKYQIPNTDKIEVAGPGFINFSFSRGYFVTQLQALLEANEDENISTVQDNRKIMLEFGDPNPFKEFHIGHLLIITLGESFARTLEAQGATVIRANYEGDVGMHVAKAMYGLLQIPNPKSQIPTLTKDDVLKIVSELDAKTLTEKIKILGAAYAAGAKAYEEDTNSMALIRSINIKIYQGDEVLRPLWEKGRAWSLEQFEEIYRRVGTQYKHYFFESAITPLAKEIIDESTQSGVFEKSDGAIVFKGEQVGLHTRVFLTKEGNPTYEGKDMALALRKEETETSDASFIITAHEQAEYFKVILAALKLIAPVLASKTQHFSTGFVKLRDGKMSSRLGNTIAGNWLLSEAKRQIEENYKEMDEKTAEIVAVGAVKYSFLKFARGSDISFDFNDSISLEGNSGPYLQYTYVRTQSILKKYEAKYGKISLKNVKLTAEDFNTPEEAEILRLLEQFREVVAAAANEFMPSNICTYLFTLAQSFNLFYQKHKVLSLDDSSAGEVSQSLARIALTIGLGKTLKRGLYLLGISVPEKM